MAFSRRSKLVAVAGATVAAIGGITFSASASTSASGPAYHAVAPAAMTSAHRSAPKVISQLIGHGLVDGQSWSVTLEYHLTLPKGYHEALPPSMAQSSKAHTSLLCQRMVIGGVPIDQQTGPWADCTAVNGPHDQQIGAYGGGLRGLNDKQGIPGSRLFVGTTTMPNVAYGTVVLTNGQVLTGHVATIPHTGYHGWAVAIPNHHTMTSFNLYDAHHHRLAHQTWN